jgi:hypothetical protein
MATNRLTPRSAHTHTHTHTPDMSLRKREQPQAQSQIHPQSHIQAQSQQAAGLYNNDDDNNTTSEHATLIELGTYNNTANHHTSANNRSTLASSSSSSSLPHNLRRYRKGLFSVLPTDITAYMNRRWIRYPFYLSILLVIAGIIGYVIFWCIDVGLFDPAVHNKTMVVYSMETTPFTAVQGAFSDFEAAVGALCYGLDHQAAAVKLIYNNPLYADPAAAEQHGAGGGSGGITKDNSNYWTYFYESNVFVLNAAVYATNPQEVHFNGWLARYGKLGSFTREVIGSHRQASQPYPIAPYRPLSYVSDLVHTYIKPKQFIINDVHEFIHQHWPHDSLIIGIHYRGTDKVNAYPYVSPSFAVYDYYVTEAIKKLRTSDSQAYHIYIATDSTDFLEWAKEMWGNKISYQKDTPRMSSQDKAAREGGTHKSNEFTPYQKGYTSLIDCLLLSRTQYLIKNRSGLSDVSIWFADQSVIKWSMIIGSNDDVYHSQNAGNIFGHVYLSCLLC